MVGRNTYKVFVVLAIGFIVPLCIGQTNKVLSGRELLKAMRGYDTKRQGKSDEQPEQDKTERVKKGRPTVNELLDKYAETQNKLQSFRLKSKDIINSASSFQGGRNRPQYTETDFRFDGDRTSFRRNIWGSIGERSFTRDQASYHSTLWDGESFIRHSRKSDLSTVDRVVFHNDKKRGEKLGKETVSRAYQGHSLMGYFYGDDERVDSILRQAASISVRRENEKVNDIDCFVIDATTLERGKYTLWIDPEHGYNIAKAELRRDGKHQHKFYGRPMREDEKILASLENVRFKKIDNVWVPMEVDDSVNRTWDKNEDFYRHKVHHERYEFVLNPDHEALGSFVPDDIKNGAEVYISGVKGITYTWRGDKVVDAQGREVDLDALKPKGPVLLVGKRLPSFGQFRAKLDPAEVEGKRILVCFWDMNQRPSRNCALRIKSKAGALSSKGVYVILVHAEPVDKDKLKQWLGKHDVALPVCRVTGDAKQVKQEWNVQRLPWLILADEKHVVRAEGFGIEELDDKVGGLSNAKP